MLYPSKIDERASRLRSGIKALHKPPAQDYANIIEHRRRARVAENRQMEEGVTHDNNIHKRVQLMNAATERHRLEGYFRLGQVPAHIVHPLVRSILKLPHRVREPSTDSQSSSLMDVDDDAAFDVPDPMTGLVIEMGSRGRAGGTQADTIKKAKKARKPGFEDFTPEELKVGAGFEAGAAARLLYPEAIVSRNFKMTARNVESRRRFAITDAKKLAAAAKKAGVDARKAAKQLAKRSAA